MMLEKASKGCLDGGLLAFKARCGHGGGDQVVVEVDVGSHGVAL